MRHNERPQVNAVYSAGLSCGPLTPVEFSTNTSSDSGSNRFPDQVNITCDPGYELGSGDLIRNCTSSGMWDGTDATCVGQ